MDIDQIEKWLKVNKNNKQGNSMPWTSFTLNKDQSVDVQVIDISNQKFKKLPFKINLVTNRFFITYTPLLTMENFPNKVNGSFDISGTEITSLQGLPNYIGKHCFLKNIPIKNPYGYRHVFQSNIIGEIETSFPEINKILNEYKNRKEYMHIAIDKLLELAEKMGFDND